MPRSPAPASALALVILAAGQGKRMHSRLPKVLQPLAGKPLLGHVLDTARELAPASIHVVFGHGGEQVRGAFTDAPVRWVEQAQQLGTGHALQQAMPGVADADLVLTLCGDVPLVRAQTLRELLAKAGPKSLALLTVTLEDPTGYGRVLRDRRGRVRRIVEQKDAGPKELRVREVNTGILAAPARALRGWLKQLKADNAQGEYYLTDVIALAVADGFRVEPVAAPTQIEVLGVNDRLQLAAVESEYRGMRARELLRAGATLVDPARVDVRGTVGVGRDVHIDINVILEGAVQLGDGVRVGPNCLLRDVRIGARTEIFSNCVLDGGEIGADCLIGPFARIRPQTRLADGVHVGNFVEVKNSQMGVNSKANHLSYVGDAQVGARVNVGAGTIVANYDGANKHRTTIGDDVHTGSNSVIVAPITLGAGATIGAGSTVTADAPAGKLTLARARQVTIEDWQRPKKK
jgi:bifunctional UDP-N-acetylglucosamine pyrophosphorylase/glucosamine-1-phosphate N-acetyltransferase